MKILFFLALFAAIGLNAKAQDLDVFQANLAWDYHANHYDAYNLGNGWQIQPELKYYFTGISYGQSFMPNKSTLTYQHELLIGAYFRPTWGTEWKRDSVMQYPLIIKGRPQNANAKQFDFGLSFLYIPNPAVFITLEGGLSLKSLEIKTGVRDSVPVYPYYQSVPLKLEFLYSEDAFLFFNRIRFTLETNNSFNEYRAITIGGEKFVDTALVSKERFFSAGLDFTVWAPQVGETLIDFSLVNRYLWYRGTDYFGLNNADENTWDYRAGIGINLRHYGKLENFLGTELLLGRQGLTIGLETNLSALLKY
jgi:hypothetical protein